jgi:eukaryotic translation initiation factor 2C
MRFFATADSDKDRSGNLPAGLVVDSGVTDPFIFEFYRKSTFGISLIPLVQAHPGLQGTAKPTHYVVVSDDNKVSLVPQGLG